MLQTKTSWKIVTDPYATEEQWLPACGGTADSVAAANSIHEPNKALFGGILPKILSFVHTPIALAISALGGITAAQTIHAWNNLQNTVLEFLVPSSLWHTGFFSWYNHPVALFLMIPLFLSYFFGLACNKVNAKVALPLVACYFAIAFFLYNNDSWPMSMSYARLVLAGGAISALPMYLFGCSVGRSLERGGFKNFFSVSVIGFLYAVLFIQPVWFLSNFWLTLFTCFLIPFSSAAAVAWHYQVKNLKTACALGLNAVVPFLVGLTVYFCIGLAMMAENHFSGYENWFLNFIRLGGPATLILFLGPAGGAFSALLRRAFYRSRSDSENLSPI